MEENDKKKNYNFNNNNKSNQVKIKNLFNSQKKDHISQEENSRINGSNYNNYNYNYNNNNNNNNYSNLNDINNNNDNNIFIKNYKNNSRIELVQNDSKTGLLGRQNSNHLIKSINENIKNQQKIEMISKEFNKKSSNENFNNYENISEKSNPPKSQSICSLNLNNNIQVKKYSEDNKIQKNKTMTKKKNMNFNQDNYTSSGPKKRGIKKIISKNDEKAEVVNINNNDIEIINNKALSRKLTKREKIVKIRITNNI
jgi:hypothetical protein